MRLAWRIYYFLMGEPTCMLDRTRMYSRLNQEKSIFDKEKNHVSM